jgi:hypothetical protein
MPLTPAQLAELQRLKEMFKPAGLQFDQRMQGIANMEKMAGKGVSLPTDKKAKGGLAKFIAESKVKNRAYHGTQSDFKEFKSGPRNKLVKGMWFSQNPDDANYWAGKGQGANVMPVHLQLKNPASYEDYERMLKELPDEAKRTSAQRAAQLKKRGHDGLIVNSGTGNETYVALHNKQIKSAIGNRGTYDPNDPDITKAKGGKIEVRPTVFDDAASRRNPNIEAAARALAEGKMKQAAYAKVVAKEKPVKAYNFIPKPATDEQAMSVLIDRQKQNWKSHNNWPAGHRVGLRLDIPAYERHGVWVNSIHDESGGQDKFPTSYGSVSSVRNATFEGSPSKAIRVATGEQTKTPFARIKGELEHIDEDQAVKHFQKYLNHPDYRQVGYDPRRHGDFYDRETMQPITHSEHVVQIGPLVLAKKPVYGKRSLYARGGKVTHAHHLDIEERPL